MKKIPTLFERNETGDRVIDIMRPGLEWVKSAEATATRKLDGTACLVKGAKLYKRYTVKLDKTPPADFLPAQSDREPNGTWPGWIPVGDGPEDKWYREAESRYKPSRHTLLPCQPLDGTYELCGPHASGGAHGGKNPEHLDEDTLIPHGADVLLDVPTDFHELHAYLAAHDIEGIVWWRDINDPDCDKAKIKRRDFGLTWPVAAPAPAIPETPETPETPPLPLFVTDEMMPAPSYVFVPVTKDDLRHIGAMTYQITSTVSVIIDDVEGNVTMRMDHMSIRDPQLHALIGTISGGSALEIPLDQLHWIKDEATGVPIDLDHKPASTDAQPINP